MRANIRIKITYFPEIDGLLHVTLIWKIEIRGMLRSCRRQKSLLFFKVNEPMNQNIPLGADMEHSPGIRS